jgi:glucokinase
METLFAGLDIGGQSIKGIVLDSAGRMVRKSSRPTPAREGAQAVLETIRQVIAELSETGKLVSVGVGTPGGVDREGTIVGMSANIDGWYGTRLGAAIGSMAKAPCGVRNDGNIAAYAEWAVRGGSSKALLFMGLGTGIGGGYIEEGKILGGCDDRALEIGHFIIEPSGRNCVCGISGCSEAYASGPSIGRIATALALGEDAFLGSLARDSMLESFGSFEDSALAARAREGLHINAREVYEAFTRGDSLARAVDSITAWALARTAATALALLAPDLVVLGGGVIQGAGHLPEAIAAKMSKLLYIDGWRHCRFEPARLSHRAGLLGAAFYAASLVGTSSDVFALSSGPASRE